MMRFAVRTLPPPTLADKYAVIPCLAAERSTGFPIIHIGVLVSFFEVGLSLIPISFGSLVGVDFGIITQPGESEEVADVELHLHAFASCILALWHSLQIAAYTPTFGQGAQ